MNNRVTVREACRRRMPLDGADAQALEHALSQVEVQRDRLRDAILRLMQSADASWEEQGLGHDWREAVEFAREAVRTCR